MQQCAHNHVKQETQPTSSMRLLTYRSGPTKLILQTLELRRSGLCTSTLARKASTPEGSRPPSPRTTLRTSLRCVPSAVRLYWRHILIENQQLPSIIQDIYIQVYGVPATSEILTFLKRELMQEVWLLLLDDAFMYIYVHGLALLCGDAIRLRTFPRFNIHSAVYPEKLVRTFSLSPALTMLICTSGYFKLA